jgi:hypothetical protein
MPFISKEELDKRLSSPDNLKNKIDTLFIEPLPSIGKREELPFELKKVVALLGSDPEREESKESIGKAFNITQPSVSHLSRGRTGITRDYEHPVLKSLIDKNQSKRESAETKAIDVLLGTLDIIPTKLSDKTPVKTLSNLAKSMSEVADRMSSRKSGQEGIGQQVHLHIFVPKQKDVDEYDVIDV